MAATLSQIGVVADQLVVAESKGHSPPLADPSFRVGSTGSATA